jgi:hypothetical protein
MPALVAAGKEQAQEHHRGESARHAEPIGRKTKVSERLCISHASYPHTHKPVLQGIP